MFKKEFRFSCYHEIISWELRAAIVRYVKVWEGVFERKEGERVLLISTVEQPRLSIIVLCSALLECSINFYLGIKADEKRFSAIERKSLFAKWAKIPKEFVPSYRLPAELSRDLDKLIKRRNAIVHPKPLLSIDGDNRHKGNEPPDVLDEHNFIGRCSTLPYRLVDHLVKSDDPAYLMLTNLHTCCGAVANEFERRHQVFEVRSKVPRKLIAEIMEQGHDRETAMKCAIHLLQGRSFDESGKARIWLGIGKSVLLEPLKFFAKQ